MCNSELDFSILRFLTQLRGLKELVLTGNSFYGGGSGGLGHDFVTLGIDQAGNTTVESNSSIEQESQQLPDGSSPPLLSSAAPAANYSLQSLSIYKNTFESEQS